MSKDVKEVTWQATWLSGGKASSLREQPVQRPWGEVFPVCPKGVGGEGTQPTGTMR